MSLPVALTIAGSDSGGGAGIQADIKTFQAFGVFGTSAITAITAQNTQGVHSVHSIPGDIVRDQITMIAGDFDVRAVKSGMLSTHDLVQLVAATLIEQKLQPYVLDPVMVATSGARLLADDAVESIVNVLLPLATLVTPNLDEARIMTGLPIRDVAGMRAAAQQLVERGAAAALVKGGHLEGARVTDVLFDGSTVQVFERERIETSSTHGTGCTLSAAITAGLAHGRTLHCAVGDGLDFVRRAILAAPGIGHGHGPLNHLVSGPTTRTG